MSTQGGEDQCLARMRLPADFVEPVQGVRGRLGAGTRLGSWHTEVRIRLREAGGDFREIAAAVNGDFGREAGFLRRFHGSDHAHGAAVLRGARRRKGCEQSAARRRPQAALQIEFGHAQPRDSRRRPLAVSDHDRGRQSEVERQSELGQLRGNQVEQHFAAWIREAMRGQSRRQALARLARDRVGHAGEHGAGKPASSLCFDAHQARARAVHRGSVHAMPHRVHHASVGSK